MRRNSLLHVFVCFSLRLLSCCDFSFSFCPTFSSLTPSSLEPALSVAWGSPSSMTSFSYLVPNSSHEHWVAYVHGRLGRVLIDTFRCVHKGRSVGLKFHPGPISNSSIFCLISAPKTWCHGIPSVHRVIVSSQDLTQPFPMVVNLTTAALKVAPSA